MLLESLINFLFTIRYIYDQPVKGNAVVTIDIESLFFANQINPVQRKIAITEDWQILEFDFDNDLKIFTRDDEPNFSYSLYKYTITAEVEEEVTSQKQKATKHGYILTEPWNVEINVADKFFSGELLKIEVKFLYFLNSIFLSAF